jgi:two-component system NarL family sensor kinase
MSASLETGRTSTEATQPIPHAQPATTDWINLTHRPRGRTDSRVPRLRTVLLQVCAAGLIVVAIVVAVGALISRRTAESQSVNEVARFTNVLAESVVQPKLTNAMATSSTAAAAGLDKVVRDQVLSDTLVRVKIWNPQGKIIYSDDSRLVDKQFDLDEGARAALAHPQVRAEITDLQAPENRFERGNGPLLEVYRPVWTPNGSPLLFETYFNYNQVSHRAAQLWRGFVGILLSSIAAILVLLIPLGWTLVARARRAHRQREDMLERAMDASLDERRRIAAALHDGVVQELAAASFAVAGSAQDASTRGDAELAERLSSAGEAVRTSIGSMRSLLVDIYPPSLRSAGISAALRDLANTVRIPVDVLIDEGAGQSLSQEQQEAVFRIAQESLRNAAAHAAAQRVTLSLRREGAHVILEVADDGVGFDAAGARPEGHFGLSLMADIARNIDAELAVRTAVGQGTTWRLTITR